MIKFIFTLLLTVLANTSPATAEFTPITDSNIADAVNLWQSDEASATTTYGHISDWDTSGVTDMGYLFVNAAKFNADISKWNTSMVIDFTQMFLGAKKFDGDLSDWVTSSATHMTSMFNTAEAFNGDISKWDTSSCTSMQGMFAGAKSFNRDISGWDTSKVTAMGFLFNDAIWFNADISKWNTQSVTNTRDTYKGACSLECEHYPTDHAGDCPVSPSAECENIGNRCATKTDEAECNDLYESCTWYNAECSTPAPTSAPTPGPRPLNPSPDFFISRAGFNKNVCAETNGDGIFKKKKCDVLSYGRQLFTLDTVTGLFYNQAADQCLDSHDVTAENPSPPYMDNCNKANYNQQWEIVPETNELRVRRENLGGGGDNGKRWCLDDVGAYYDGATWAMSPCRNLAPNTPEEDMNFHMYMLFRSYTAAPTLPPTMAPTMFPTTMSPTVAGPVTATEGEYISGWTFSPEENTSCDEVCAAVGSVCDETVFIEAMVEADLTTSTNGFETWFPEATRDVSVWQKFGAINKKVMGTNAVPGIRQTASDKNQGFVFGMTVDHGYRDQAGIESCKWEGGDFYPACYCGAAPTKAPTPPPPYVTASDIDGEYIPGWTFSANDYVSCSNVCTAVDSVCHEETFHNAIVAANLSTDGVGGDTWFPESLNVTVWTGFNRSFTNIVNGNVGPPCIRQDNLGSLYGYRPNLIVPQIQSCYWKKIAYYPACYCGKATVAPTESPTMVPTTAAPTPEPYILPSIPSGSKYIWGKKFMYCASICSSAGMECRESDVQPEFEFDSQKKLETLIANGDFAAYDGSPAEDGIPTDAFTKNWKTGGESTDTTCPYYNTINASYNWCSAGQTKVKDRCYAQSQNQLYLCLCHEKTESPTMVPTSAAPTSAAPTSATPTTAAPTTAAPTTSAPVTSAPTTAAPTTSAPVTSAPVTSAPTSVIVRDRFCEVGNLVGGKSNSCCLSSCARGSSACGGDKCGRDGNKATDCCAQRIVEGSPKCSVASSAPCVLDEDDRNVAFIMKRMRAETATFTELTNAGLMTVVIHGTAETEKNAETFKELAITTLAETFGFDPAKVSITSMQTDDQMKTTVEVKVDSDLGIISAASSNAHASLLTLAAAAASLTSRLFH